MRAINGFDATPGTKIKVQISEVDADVVTFAGVLKRFDDDGGGIEAKWTADELVHGVSAKLGDAHGYDVIILPVSKPGTNPSMTASLDAPSVGFRDRQVQSVGDNVPFGWRIFVD
jgi:hypothetical protein